MEDKGKIKPKYLDPKDFYTNELDSWELLWDEDASFYDNILNLVKKTVFLPNQELYALVSIYVVFPSKWIRVAGILFSHGDQGSGKSSIATLANKIHGFQSTFSPSDTFASIRNALDGMRWIDPVFKEMEKDGALLCWDNINIETLKREPKIYQLLLYGYSRQTDKTSIAAPDGTNKNYYVFCPKILSSVEPIHLYHEFQELRRRMLVILHKPWEKFSLQEKAAYEGIDIFSEKIDIDSYNWNGIERKFYLFWNSEQNVRAFVGWRKLITKIKGNQIPSCITSSRWAITIDLIASGLTLEVWKDIASAISYFENYWNYCDTVIFNEYSATLEHLKKFIEEETETLTYLNQQLIANGIKIQSVIIPAKKLKDRMSALQAEGSLDITPNNKDIQSLMWQLGFKLSTKGWVEK
jgi:hypothetical protein